MAKWLLGTGLIPSYVWGYMKPGVGYAETWCSQVQVLLSPQAAAG